MCSVCNVEPTLAWGCATISDFCLSDVGTTCAGLLGCEGVTTFTFLLRPALPCPDLGFFQVGVLTSGDTIIGFNVCFSGCTCGFMPLSTPCTSGYIMLLDLDLDLICTKYLSSVLMLPI